MNQHRAERYRSGCPAASEAQIPSLNAEEISEIRAGIKERLGFKDADDESLLKLIHGRATRLASIRATESSFSLKSLCPGVEPNDELLLVWDGWKDVDKGSFEVIDRDFENIWFPIADDLDIFDRKGRWAVLIEHTGAVSLFVPEPER